MAKQITIQGVPYPAPERFTNREIATIQRISHTLPKGWEDAINGGDINMTVAIAMVVLTRAGQTPDIEKLYDLEPGFVDAINDEADEPVPPVAAEVAASNGDPILTSIPSSTPVLSGAQD